MPWKACYLICFLVCVLFNAKRKKENTEVFYCTPLAAFRGGLRGKSKGHHISAPGNVAQDGCILDEQEGNLQVWSQSLPISACRSGDCAAGWHKTAQGLCGLAFHRHSSHFRAWQPPHRAAAVWYPAAWVQLCLLTSEWWALSKTSTRNWWDWEKNLIFIAQIKVQDCFCWESQE